MPNKLEIGQKEMLQLWEITQFIQNKKELKDGILRVHTKIQVIHQLKL
jgi:hypothetical protein